MLKICFVFLMFLLLFSICLSVFFPLALSGVLICGLKPKEAYLKSACTVRKFNEAHSEAIPEKKKFRLSLKETNKAPT